MPEMSGRQTVAFQKGKWNMGSIAEEENKLFAELRINNPDIVDDGVASEEDYLSAKYKIMYVLKEVNGGKSWSLREFVRDGGRPQTWDNIARWTEAIFDLDTEKPWSYWENDNEDRRKKILKTICAVNVKKTSGGHTSHADEIYQAAIDNSAILQKQLSLYNPDIIICCGTEKAFVDACYKNQEPDWKMTSRGIWYFVDNDTVVISFAHPEARVKDCFLHYALVDAVKEIRSVVNLRHTDKYTEKWIMGRQGDVRRKLVFRKGEFF